MRLNDFINRRPAPVPWNEGENIPWNEPGFSERMLHEHLSQEHDAASRRTAKIDRHVEWIHREVLRGHRTQILDLGCGPGLYTDRLAKMRHACTGIDFSPASIRYAREQTKISGTACAYTLGDLRQATYGEGYGLAMFLFGEFNVFRPSDIRAILNKAHAALAANGLLLVEVSTHDAVCRLGHQTAHWYTSPGGLFSPEPHVVLQESFWDDASATATTRHVVIDAATADATLYAATYQAYTCDAITGLLSDCGFNALHFYPSLLGTVDELQSDFMAIVASAMA